MCVLLLRCRYAKDKGALGGISSFLAVTVARSAVMPFNYVSLAPSMPARSGPDLSLTVSLITVSACFAVFSRSTPCAVA